jgi:hypothetical protein
MKRHVHGISHRTELILKVIVRNDRKCSLRNVMNAGRSLFSVVLINQLEIIITVSTRYIDTVRYWRSAPQENKLVGR